MNSIGMSDKPSSNSSAKDIVAEINTIMKGMSVEDRNEKKNALAAASYPANPTAIAKITDTTVLNKILEIVKA
jgi:hypothetical protein